MAGTEGLELLARMEALFAAVAAKNLAGIEACYLNEPSLLVFLEDPRTRNVGWENIRVGWRHFIDAHMRLKSYEWGEDRLERVSVLNSFSTLLAERAVLVEDVEKRVLVRAVQPHFVVQMRGR